MARRTASVLINQEGRDRGDVFTLTEMPAEAATWWAIRALQLLVRSGTDVPPHLLSMGWAGFVTLGIGTVLGGLGKAPPHDVKPLLDELLTCVTTLQKATAQVEVRHWPVIKSQIEEPTTFFQIYEEVVSLHLGFSLAARLSNYRTLVTNLLAIGVPTETSTQSSEQSSQAV